VKVKIIFVMKHLVLALLICGGLYWLSMHRKGQGKDIPRRLGQFEKVSPNIVLIGNSVLRAGIDETMLSQLMNKRIFMASSNGSASVWWYLYVKNVVGEACHKPEVAVIFFRDHYLTLPKFRTEGKFRKPLRMLSRPQEPLVEQLAYGKDVVPMVWARAEAKERLERRILKTAAKFVGVNKNVASDALANVLGESQMIPEFVTRQQLASEQVNDMRDLDFDACLSRSLLPHMISMLHEKGVKLVLVRCKRRRDTQNDGESIAVQEYMKQLSNYVRANDVSLIDFTHDDRLTLSHYGPGDHLNDEGKRVFTQMVAEKLAML